MGGHPAGRSRGVTRRDWRYHAACKDASPSEASIFIQGYAGRDQATWMRAAVRLSRTYCQRCPVRAQCLAWAMKEPGFTGLAAGVVFQFLRGGIRRRATTLHKEAE